MQPSITREIMNRMISRFEKKKIVHFKGKKLVQVFNHNHDTN